MLVSCAVSVTFPLAISSSSSLSRTCRSSSVRLSPSLAVSLSLSACDFVVPSPFEWRDLLCEAWPPEVPDLREKVWLGRCKDWCYSHRGLEGAVFPLVCIRRRDIRCRGGGVLPAISFGCGAGLGALAGRDPRVDVYAGGPGSGEANRRHWGVLGVEHPGSAYCGKVLKDVCVLCSRGCHKLDCYRPRAVR